MKRFTIFTFDDIEDVNDAFGFDCFDFNPIRRLQRS